MRIKMWAVVVGVLAGVFSAFANAAVLVTPSLTIVPGHIAECQAVNLSSQRRAVTLAFIKADGTVYDQVTVSVEAGGIAGFAAGVLGATGLYCKITMPNVAAANMRGSILDQLSGLSLPAQ